MLLQENRSTTAYGPRRCVSRKHQHASAGLIANTQLFAESQSTHVRRRGWTAITTIAGALVLLLVAMPSYSSAKPGGNGGGKPGGGDPPALPNVRYNVFPVTTPNGGYVYFDHNNDAAVVGWNTIDDSGLGRRSFAYLPGISTTQAYYLDDPILGVSNIRDGWHTRTAIGINKHNTIVGNLEPDGVTDNSSEIPFVINDIYSTSPRLDVLGPFDSNADRESVNAINDNGDLAVLSERGAAGASPDRVFVGNLYNDPSATSFLEIDFAAQGLLDPDVADGSFSKLQLSEPIGNQPAYLAGVVREGEQQWVFRTSLDGSSFEKLLVGDTFFTDSQGDYSISLLSPAADITAEGDVMLTVAVKSPKGKGKYSYYSAIWQADDSSIVPVPGVDDLETWHSYVNDDADYLLNPTGGNPDALWHADWSIENGPIAITELIDPNDPYVAMYSGARELTNRDATGWPTLVTNSGGSLLVLRPQVIASASAVAAAVPEPTSALLLVIALTPLALSRPRRSAQP
jgi:hypothetical protein